MAEDSHTIAEDLFADGKDAGAMRTIGEVAAAYGLRQHVLRYWEAQFPMLQPLKRSGGRRLYRRADVAMVETIDRLVNREGYTLKGARKAIEQGIGSPTNSPSGKVAPPPVKESVPVATSKTLLPELKRIRDSLAAALAA